MLLLFHMEKCKKLSSYIRFLKRDQTVTRSLSLDNLFCEEKILTTLIVIICKCSIEDDRNTLPCAFLVIGA